MRPAGTERRRGHAAPLVAAVVAALSAGAGPVAATGGSPAGGPAAETLPPLEDWQLNLAPAKPDDAARVASVTELARDFGAAEPYEDKPGGAATVRLRANADAFSQPSANIGFAGELDFKVGNGLFRKIWVQAPSSTLASDGLGPLYNARGCQNCHIKDGRGHPPEGSKDEAVSMFLRISVPQEADPTDPAAGSGGSGSATGGDAAASDAASIAKAIPGWHPTAPDPVYGGQLQDFAVNGLKAEYRLDVTYAEETVALAGGETASLRRPTYRAADLGYGPLDPRAMLSPRVAPQMIGLGQLEAIPAATILSWADPDDADGDGISGWPNIVPSLQYGRPMLGRFGHKAGMPTIREQSAAAFAGDIGISSPLFPQPYGDCTDAQAACRNAPHGDGDARGTEIDAKGMDLVTFYSHNLAVPARPDAGDPQVLRGKELFYTTGCTACHRPKYVTARLQDAPPQSFQLIWPYTDLLLHDMGEGLADHRPEGRASGTEWRTAPLWGIGRTKQVSGFATYLHDGRARSVLEAVLWHGGEAQPQRDAVVAMTPEQRADLVRFLESL